MPTGGQWNANISANVYLRKKDSYNVYFTVKANISAPPKTNS